MNKIISRKRTLQIIVILCILGVTIYGLRFIDFKQVLQQVEKLPFFLKSITMMSDEASLCGTGFCGKGYKEWVKVSDGGPYIKAKIRLG